MSKPRRLVANVSPAKRDSRLKSLEKRLVALSEKGVEVEGAAIEEGQRVRPIQEVEDDLRPRDRDAIARIEEERALEITTMSVGIDFEGDRAAGLGIWALDVQRVGRGADVYRVAGYAHVADDRAAAAEDAALDGDLRWIQHAAVRHRQHGASDLGIRTADRERHSRAAYRYSPGVGHVARDHGDAASLVQRAAAVDRDRPDAQRPA